MNIRFYRDPETGQPHIYKNGVNENEVDDVLRKPSEDRPGREGSRWQWVKRYLGVICELFMFPILDQTVSLSSLLMN